jgi:hypothetical protein
MTYKDILKAYSLRRNEDELYTKELSFKNEGIKLIKKGREILKKWS